MTVDDYIAKFDEPVRARLDDVRKAVRRALPRAEETIKYGIPTYVMGGRNAISFAAYKKHIGVYPVPKELEAELEPYRAAKSTAQFPHDEKLPLGLIGRMAKLLAQRNAGVPAG
jgi:uncharacterized protein YdhG (YjbR/CyaY superfamily)